VTAIGPLSNLVPRRRHLSHWRCEKGAADGRLLVRGTPCARKGKSRGVGVRGGRALVDDDATNHLGQLFECGRFKSAG
jgi:hypothetical protein